jgi:hypothetical protein
MSARRLVLSLLLLGLALDAEATNPNRYIVRIKPGLDGLSVIQQVCQLVGCTPAHDRTPIPTARRSRRLAVSWSIRPRRSLSRPS